MRTWRVGTVSMGLTLIWLGLLLLTGQLQGLGAFDALMDWWPIVLILLGAEVLLYLYFSRRKERNMIQYDFLSVIFVGFLYAGCLGFAVLTGTGLMEEVRGAVAESRFSVKLPDFAGNVEPGIKKVVLMTGGQQIKIDQSTERAVMLFGTVQATGAAQDYPAEPNAEDVYTSRTAGDTLYIQVHPMAEKTGLRRSYASMVLTAVVPSDVEVELRGPNHEVLEQPS